MFPSFSNDWKQPTFSNPLSLDFSINIQSEIDIHHKKIWTHLAKNEKSYKWFDTRGFSGKVFNLPGLLLPGVYVMQDAQNAIIAKMLL